ncbi:MAG: hypothetical protein ACKVS5_04140 [Parvularculaceae bacterium]
MGLIETAASRARKAKEAEAAALRMRVEKARLGERLGKMKAKARPALGPAIDAEQREWPRARGYNVATALVGVDRTVSCRIVDCGYGGMRIEFHDDAPQPEEFALTVPTLRFVGIVRRAWQSKRQCGVAILRWSETG